MLGRLSQGHSPNPTVEGRCTMNPRSAPHFHIRPQIHRHFYFQGAPMTISLRLLVLAVAMLISVNGTAREQPSSGQELLSKLEGNTSQQIDGMLFVGQVLFSKDKETHCKPAEATVGQAAAITRKFLNANPEMWQQNAASLVIVALGRAWPCPR